MIDFREGVYLRGLLETDLEHAFNWRNDRRVWKWCRQNDILQWDNHVAWFHSTISDPSIRMYAITSRDEPSRVVGVCGLTSIDTLNRRAEFSLYIDPELHGEGYGHRALKTLIAHGFLNLGLNVVWGETYDGNPAAEMFGRVGLKKEGTRRQFYFRDGRFIDAHLYSITRDEWAATLEGAKWTST